MSEYIGRLLSDTDKLIAALEELERSHKHFSVIKYKLNKEAGKIADLVTSCRRSIAFMADDPALKPLSGELEKYGELFVRAINIASSALFSSNSSRNSKPRRQISPRSRRA